MNWKSVDSTRMNAIAWENNITYIRFHDGSIYAYNNVTEAQHNAFANSSSLGHALNEFQRSHPYERIN